LDSILLGFSVSLAPGNLLACFVGAVIGTLIGVLPGIGPVATISLLLPVTLYLSPISATIMLAGIYYGAQYGGSITSILLNIPGEATTVVTCIEGYKMARQGRAGPALAMSAIGSFIAGTLGVIGLMLFGPPLANFALNFGPTEYSSLIFFSLMLVGYFGGKSLTKAIMMAGVGLLIGTVGQDFVTQELRFDFGISEFADGISQVPVLMGLFGVAEVLCNIEQIAKASTLTEKIGRLLPSWRDWRDSFGPILRGSGIGFFMGIIPGSGAIIPPFTSYALEKKISKHPEKFGNGAIEGLAGPEASNNAAAQGSFLPLLCLGLPPNAVAAILLGALMIHGVRVGPLLMSERPDLFWGVVTSMYVGNILLLILNLPLIPLWVRVLKVPYYILFPLILLFCLVGAYSVNNSLVDVVVLIVFGFAGYWMRKYEYEVAPLVLGLVLGPIFEYSFRQSMILSQGDFTVFITRPLSAVFVIAALALPAAPLAQRLWRAAWPRKSSPAE
jgi:putative tricarboxylic transport membrane protein